MNTTIFHLLKDVKQLLVLDIDQALLFVHLDV